MEFLETEDGSLTVRHPVLGELYHSDRGAVGEAEHVYIRAGFEAVSVREPAVFEVGFGTGLNAWLTLQRAAETGRRVDYRAIELYPVERGDAGRLNYTDDPLFLELHDAAWDGVRHEVGAGCGLTKYRADLLRFDFAPLAGRFDVIYFDAFAPDVQPELWSAEVMERMFSILKPGGVLVTYSAKGTVKQALRTAGFEVVRLPGALGKRHMVRAVKPSVE